MSSLFWAVLDQEQKEKSEELLATFDKDSKDEFGLMSLTIALSNLMFPGTSVLQTRLRYVFFVGWIFLESFGKNYSIKKLHENEKKLRKILQDVKKVSDENFLGILGITKEIDLDGNGDELSQPPFSIYFNLLKSWKIIKVEYAQLSIIELNENMFDEKYIALVNEIDLDNIIFVLTLSENEYLQQKIPNSLLKEILENPSLLKDEEEDVPFIGIDSAQIKNDDFKKYLKYSQNLSILMWGTMLYYNYFLGNGSDPINNNFEKWKVLLQTLFSSNNTWKPIDTTDLILNVVLNETAHNSRVDFIEKWYEYVKTNYQALRLENPPSIGKETLFDFLERRENNLKGDRARLTKKKKDVNYQESNAKYGLNPIEYRWGNIRRFVKDFHATN